MWRTLGIVGAILIHVIVLLFGGILFFGKEDLAASHQDVELIGPEDAKKDEPKPEPPPEKPPEVQQEKPPDASEILRSMETPMPNDGPALEAASLSALEQALNGGGGGGWGGGVDLNQTGGRLGASGKGGGDAMDSVMDLAEIDQKPRPVYQAAPFYPSEMRGKKVEGVVSILCIVTAEGRVQDPRIENSNHHAFDKPALDAIKQWKFEAAVKGGKRVPCRIRVPLRFQPS